MSIINPGDFPIDPQVVDGTELADRLNRLKLAQFSNHANATRPPDVVAGGLWTRTGQAGDPTLMLYNGTTDIPIVRQNSRELLLGQNADQSKNFKINVPTPEDGTLTIERADGTDVLTVAANNIVNIPGRVTGVGTVVAACIVDGTAAGVNAPLAGFGVVSVNRSATGSYAITLGKAYADNNFIVSAMADTGALNQVLWSGATTGSVTLTNYVAGVPTDCSRLFVTILRADNS